MEQNEKTEWIMTVTHEDGTKEEFKGNRTLSEMLFGAKKYLESIRDKQKPQ